MILETAVPKLLINLSKVLNNVPLAIGMAAREIVRALASSPSEPGLAKLRAHLAEEAAARKRGDRGTLVRLSGEFPSFAGGTRWQ